MVHGVAGFIYDICWRIDLETRPLLHRGTIYILFRMVEGDPGDWFVFGNLGLLHQRKSESFIIECNCEYGTWLGPCANKHMMESHFGG